MNTQLHPVIEQHFQDLRAEGIIKLFGLRLVDVEAGKQPHYRDIDKACAEEILASLPERDAHDLLCVCVLDREVANEVTGNRSLEELEKIRLDAVARFVKLRKECETTTPENPQPPRPRPGKPVTPTPKERLN